MVWGGRGAAYCGNVAGRCRVDNEMKIEVSLDEVREFMQNALSMLSNMAANYRPIGPFVTVDDRCKDRWPAATKKHQRRIRDVLLGMFRERLGYHPFKMS